MFKTVFHHCSRKISHFILVLVMLVVILLPFATRVEASTANPTIDIIKVIAHTSVTIRTNYWPANETFTVRMGKYGTLAIGGTVIAATASGAGGSFEVIYNIPDSLKDESMIAIRTDSSTGFYYSYNWFYNIDSGPQPFGFVPPVGITSTVTPVPGISVTPVTTPIYSGIPTFSISAVGKDSTVTIKTVNFPAGQTFTVRMGDFGTLALSGIVVATTETGSGGSFETTYTIPDSLKGRYQIAIRMDSTAGYYSYNWFYNNSTY
jgi:hypothetical protein